MGTYWRRRPIGLNDEWLVSLPSDVAFSRVKLVELPHTYILAHLSSKPVRKVESTLFRWGLSQNHSPNHRQHNLPNPSPLLESTHRTPRRTAPYSRAQDIGEPTTRARWTLADSRSREGGHAVWEKPRRALRRDARGQSEGSSGFFSPVVVVPPTRECLFCPIVLALGKRFVLRCCCCCCCSWMQGTHDCAWQFGARVLLGLGENALLLTVFTCDDGRLSGIWFWRFPDVWHIAEWLLFS